MNDVKIIIKGNCAVKKNTISELWFRFSNIGGLRKKIPLAKPIKYYKKPYVEWAKAAVASFIIYKHNIETETQRPFQLISCPIVVTYIFYLNHHRKVDLSNLIEAPQDVLAGNAGGFLDKTVKRQRIKFDHNRYQIIADDNRDVIKNYGGSTIMYDKMNPRTEIYISEFSLKKWADTFKIWHPSMTVGVTDYRDLFNQ